jgi:hypothetical protein
MSQSQRPTKSIKSEVPKISTVSLVKQENVTFSSPPICTNPCFPLDTERDLLSQKSLTDKLLEYNIIIQKQTGGFALHDGIYNSPAWQELLKHCAAQESDIQYKQKKTGDVIIAPDVAGTLLEEMRTIVEFGGEVDLSYLIYTVCQKAVSEFRSDDLRVKHIENSVLKGVGMAFVNKTTNNNKGIRANPTFAIFKCWTDKYLPCFQNVGNMTRYIDLLMCLAYPKVETLNPITITYNKPAFDTRTPQNYYIPQQPVYVQPVIQRPFPVQPALPQIPRAVPQSVPASSSAVVVHRTVEANNTIVQELMKIAGNCLSSNFDPSQKATRIGVNVKMERAIEGTQLLQSIVKKESFNPTHIIPAVMYCAKDGMDAKLFRQSMKDLSTNIDSFYRTLTATIGQSVVNEDKKKVVAMFGSVTNYNKWCKIAGVINEDLRQVELFHNRHQTEIDEAANSGRTTTEIRFSEHFPCINNNDFETVLSLSPAPAEPVVQQTREQVTLSAFGTTYHPDSNDTTPLSAFSDN